VVIFTLHKTVAIFATCCNNAAMAETTWSLDEVAAELQMQPDELRRQWRRLHKREGFPRPLPHAPVWSKLLVRAWINSASRTIAAAANDDSAGGSNAAALIDAQRRALRDAMAAGRGDR
jgi:hypothetical protein